MSGQPSPSRPMTGKVLVSPRCLFSILCFMRRFYARLSAFIPPLYPSRDTIPLVARLLLLLLAVELPSTFRRLPLSLENSSERLCSDMDVMLFRR